jgi:hypothetical protein
MFQSLGRLRGLRHLRARLCCGPRCSPARPSSAPGDPSGPLAEGEPAWPRIRGRGLPSTCEPAKGTASRSCSSTWRRCHSTEIEKQI